MAMGPIFSFSAQKMGISFDNGEITTKTHAPAVGRDRYGLSKAERLLGVSDNHRSGSTLLVDARPRVRKLQKMSSNGSLLADIKNAIGGSKPRAPLRADNTAPTPIRARTAAIRVDTDCRSILSDTKIYPREPPKSSSTVPSYYYEDSPTSPHRSKSQKPSEPSHSSKKINGRYSQGEQDKILDNLLINGMIPTKMAKGVSDKHEQRRTSNTKRQSERKNSQGLSRRGLSALKPSGTNLSIPAHGRSRTCGQGSRENSRMSNTQSSSYLTVKSTIAEEGTYRSGQQSFSIWPAEAPAPAPDFHSDRIDSPEGERVRTWLTYSAHDEANPDQYCSDWSNCGRFKAIPPSRSSDSLQTLNSIETETIFPIQGGPGDWASERSPGRQRSFLVEPEDTISQPRKSSTGKAGKVYYTDLQVESVLALSESDTESDNGSVDSALYRKRMSMISNGNETQPTVWSSVSSSYSRSRKMSVNARSMSPQRLSTSSDQWNYSLATTNSAQLSRELPGKPHSSEEWRRHSREMQSQPRQASPVRLSSSSEQQEQLPSVQEDTASPMGRGPPSSPTLSPVLTAPPLFTRMSIITPEQSPNPLLSAVRAEEIGRKASASSHSSAGSGRRAHISRPALSCAPPHPAPTKPLPTPPIETPVSAVPEGDKSSVFTFPKPPRQNSSLSRSRSRSTDLLTLLTDSTASLSTPIAAATPGPSDSVETVKLISAQSSLSNLSPLSEHPTSSTALSSPAAQDSLSSMTSTIASTDPIMMEEFSPMRLAFPLSIRRQMADPASSRTKVRLDAPPCVDVHVRAHRGKALGAEPVTREELRLHLEQLPATRLIPPAPQTAPANMMQTHIGREENPLSSSWTNIPVPPIPPRSTRRFHLPTISNSSNGTTASAPSPRLTLESGGADVGTTTGLVTQSRSQTGRGSRARERSIDAGKRLEQLRLSAIGNAV